MGVPKGGYIRHSDLVRNLVLPISQAGLFHGRGPPMWGVRRGAEECGAGPGGPGRGRGEEVPSVSLPPVVRYGESAGGQTRLFEFLPFPERQRPLPGEEIEILERGRFQQLAGAHFQAEKSREHNLEQPPAIHRNRRTTGGRQPSRQDSPERCGQDFPGLSVPRLSTHMGGSLCLDNG